MDFEKGVMDVNCIHQMLKDDDMVLFLSTIAMVIEEKCLDMGEDMVEVCERLLEAAKEVNAVLGKWDRGGAR